MNRIRTWLARAVLARAVIGICAVVASSASAQDDREISYSFEFGGDRIVEFTIVGQPNRINDVTREIARCLGNMPEAHRRHLAPIYIVPTLPGGRTTGSGFYPKDEAQSANMRAWLGRSERTGVPDALIEEHLAREDITGIIAITHARVNDPRLRIYHLSALHETAHALQAAGLALTRPGVSVASLAQKYDRAPQNIREHEAEAYSRYIARPSRVCRRDKLPSGESMAVCSRRVVRILREAPAFAEVPSDWAPLPNCRTNTDLDAVSDEDAPETAERETAALGGVGDETLETIGDEGADAPADEEGVEGIEEGETGDLAEVDDDLNDAPAGDVDTSADADVDFSNGVPAQWLVDARARYGIPAPGEVMRAPRDGWPATNQPNMGLLAGRRARLSTPQGVIANITIMTLEESAESRLNHIRWTLEQFAEDGFPPSQVDVPMVLAFKTRESRDNLGRILSSNDRRICSAGRDTVDASDCISGMDNAFNYRSSMPSSMRSSVTAIPQREICECRRCPAADRPDPCTPTGRCGAGGSCRAPARMPQSYLLAATIAQVNRQYTRGFPNSLRRKFPDLSDDERSAMIAGLTKDSRRAWTQMMWGGAGKAQTVMEYIRDNTASGETPDLNRILTDETFVEDDVLPVTVGAGGRRFSTTFSVRSARVRAAEAWLIERYLAAKGVEF